MFFGVMPKPRLARCLRRENYCSLYDLRIKNDKKKILSWKIIQYMNSLPNTVAILF